MTTKLLEFLSRYRLERRARITVMKAVIAQKEQARLRRLTSDGLDPEDPEDQLFIQIRNDLTQERDRLRDIERKTQIRQIAHRLMEEKMSAITLIPGSENQPSQLKAIAENAYKKAILIYAHTEDAEKKAWEE